MKKALIFLLLPIFSNLFAAEPPNWITLQEDLQIAEIAPGFWIHRSKLATQQWGKVNCNGALLESEGEVLIMDTPCADSQSVALLNWMKNEKGWNPVGVVVNHAHIDCLGGLALFHGAGIPSYSTQICQERAGKQGDEIPEITFKKRKKLKVGTEKVTLYFPGPGHAPGNLVVWCPSQKALFGGCMVKRVGAGYGNLNDASQEWATNVQKVAKKFPKAEIIIPGHGAFGDRELLSYTIDLFTPYPPASK